MICIIGTSQIGQFKVDFRNLIQKVKLVYFSCLKPLTLPSIGVGALSRSRVSDHHETLEHFMLISAVQFHGDADVSV